MEPRHHFFHVPSVSWPLSFPDEGNESDRLPFSSSSSSIGHYGKMSRTLTRSIVLTCSLFQWLIVFWNYWRQRHELININYERIIGFTRRRRKPTPASSIHVYETRPIRNPLQFVVSLFTTITPWVRIRSRDVREFIGSILEKESPKATTLDWNLIVDQSAQLSYTDGGEEE